MAEDAEPQVVALACGSSHSLALLRECSGRSCIRAMAHLGAAAPLQRLAPAAAAACPRGSSPPPAGTPTGTMVLSWGRGEDGQLGHGDAEDRATPQAVFSLISRGVSGVTCGAEYSCAVSAADKQLYSWGWGDFGRWVCVCVGGWLAGWQGGSRIQNVQDGVRRRARRCPGTHPHPPPLPPHPPPQAGHWRLPRRVHPVSPAQPVRQGGGVCGMWRHSHTGGH